MAKIERKYLAHFINAAAPAEPAADAIYERLGKHLTEYSPEMSAEVETNENIMGEVTVSIHGYKKTGSVEPFYAEKGSALFNRLQTILDDSLVNDDLLTDVVDVKLWEGDKDATTFPAIKEVAYIEVSSYGGDNTGYQIPFTLHYTNIKTKGTFDVKAKTFTATA